jgi:hypothetical protein
VLFIREFVVRKHERGLLYRNGDFQRFLAAGIYRFFDPRKRVEVERFDLSQPEFEHRLLDYLVRWHPEAVEDLFVRVETGAGEIAIVYRNGHPWTFVAPERRALFWKGVVHVRAELVDIEAEPAVPRRIVQVLLADLQARRLSPFERAIYVREVPEAHVGLLYVEGRLVGELAPGVHAFWQIGRNIAIEVLDARVKALEVGEQEILTKDHASLRIYLNASYRFADALLTMRSVRDPIDFLYREIQQGLRAAVGRRSLDTLLEDKSAIDRDVFECVQRKFAPLGIDIRDVGINELARVVL